MACWQRAASGLAAILLLWNTSSAANKNSDEKSAAAVDEGFSDLAKPSSPGCALGLYRDRKIIYAKGYGLANIQENVPINPQSVFDIGSNSKQFTTARILLLVQQGKH